MRETFLQRLLHAADGLRELFPLSGEDVCLWLSIGLVGGIVNGSGCGHMGSFLSWARGWGFVYCRQDGLQKKGPHPGDCSPGAGRTGKDQKGSMLVSTSSQTKCASGGVVLDS